MAGRALWRRVVFGCRKPPGRPFNQARLRGVPPVAERVTRALARPRNRVGGQEKNSRPSCGFEIDSGIARLWDERTESCIETEEAPRRGPRPRRAFRSVQIFQALPGREPAREAPVVARIPWSDERGKVEGNSLIYTIFFIEDKGGREEAGRESGEQWRRTRTLRNICSQGIFYARASEIAAAEACKFCTDKTWSKARGAADAVERHGDCEQAKQTVAILGHFA